MQESAPRPDRTQIPVRGHGRGGLYVNDRSRWAIRVAVLLLALIVGRDAAALPLDPAGSPTAAQESTLYVTGLYPSPADRLGFGAARGPVTNYDVAPLKAGWYYNWSLGENPSHPAGLAFAHLIRVGKIDWSAIQTAVAQATQNDPGALWLIGNEPDVSTMDNVMPEVYAESYYRLYHLIKAHDPTAVVAAGGIVMPTPLRLCYLQKILHFYELRYGQPLPADAWHIHNYILNEKRGQVPGVPPDSGLHTGVSPGTNKHDDMTLFRQQVADMRQWMADHGYRDRPLIVSEYGILFSQQFGYTYYRVRDFLNNTFDYFLNAADPALGYPADANRLVQAWNWFSLDDTNFAGMGLTWGALFDPTSRRRLPMGDVWVSYVNGKGLYVPYARPAPAVIRLQSAQPLFYGDAAPVNVGVLLVNTGNVTFTETLTASLYSDPAGRSGPPLGRWTLPGLLPRFAGSPTWVTTTWTLPPTAPWNLTAQVSETGASLVLGRRMDVHLDTLAVEPGDRVLVAPGQTAALTLTAHVANYGNLGLKNIRVEFWEEDPPGGRRQLHTATVAELPALAWTSVQFLWSGVRPGVYQISATLSLPAGIPEDDLSNNQAQRRILVASQRHYLALVRTGPGSSSDAEYNLVRNGSFETGDFSDWQTVGMPIVRLDPEHVPDGRYHVWMGMRGDAHDEVYQVITIPEHNICVMLLYAWGVYTYDTCDGQSPHDLLTVSLRDTTGKLLQVLDRRSECDPTEFWQGYTLDLHRYAGRTFQLHFQADTNEGYETATWFAIDYVNVMVCSGG